MNLATVLTIRMGSSRLPHKALMEIQGKPVATWIIERLKSLPGKVIVATTQQSEDNEIEDVAKSCGIPVYRGSTDDVVDRVNRAVIEHYPEAEFVFRALGDCPFIETDFVFRAADVMRAHKADAFLWGLPPDTWPVYGAREFPFSRKGWEIIVNAARGEQREHTDAYFHHNRHLFKIVYHESPQTIYFRNYRLEIDWSEDLDLVREIIALTGSNPSLSSVIRCMDANPQLTKINRERVEKTGPLTSYDYQLRRNWMRFMTGKSIVGWDNTVWTAPDGRSTPIFCESGRCLMGYAKDGVLERRNGDRIIGDAFLTCSCGPNMGKHWSAPLRRKRW